MWTRGNGILKHAQWEAKQRLRQLPEFMRDTVYLNGWVTHLLWKERSREMNAFKARPTFLARQVLLESPVVPYSPRRVHIPLPFLISVLETALLPLARTWLKCSSISLCSSVAMGSHLMALSTLKTHHTFLLKPFIQ